MIQSIDDIARQARQGSVAAIIQILNEKLAPSGVRTRAVLDNGVLQLLCEAATAEQLEQATLVERIQKILESLAPRNIRRVKINSRLVREQQLLWLEEINRDPDNQLLWYQEITLNQPNIIQRVLEDMQQASLAPESTLPKQTTSVSRYEREKRQFWRGILIGGAGLALLFVLLGWGLSSWLGLKLSGPALPPDEATTPTATPTSIGDDAFARAVRLAEQAAGAGKTANSTSQWLAIAAKWQQAADLMAAVPQTHPRHKTAVNRAALYQEYSDNAQKEAERRKQEGN
jgi:hypothetical protein